MFIAFVAMFDAILGSIGPLLIKWNFIAADKIPDWLNGLSLGKVFGWVFSPVAFLMGVAAEDVGKVGSLLGSKLSINEHYAYLQMRQLLPVLDPTTHAVVTPGQISERSFLLTAFALTGFANFSSVGIQLGGIGASRRIANTISARLGLPGAVRWLHGDAVKCINRRHLVATVSQEGIGDAIDSAFCLPTLRPFYRCMDVAGCR